MKTTTTIVSLRTNHKNRTSGVNRKSGLRSILAASIGALLGVTAASNAATFTYDDGGATLNWSDANNWNPNAAPTITGAPGHDLVFSVHTLGAGIRNAGNDLLTNVNSITFGGQAFLLNGNALTLAAGGITNNSANTQTLSFGGTGITLGALQTWNANTGALNVTSALNTGGNSLFFTGAQNTTLGGNISGGGTLIQNGTGNVIVNGTDTGSTGAGVNSGTLTVNGSLNNTMNVAGGTLAGTGSVGNISLTNGGTINFGAGAVSTGNLGVSGTGGNWNGLGTITVNANVTAGNLNIGATGNLTTTAGMNVSGAATISASGPASTITGSLNYTSTANSTFQGVIAGAGSSLTMNGVGSTLILTGNSTYGGATNILNGTVQVDVSNALPATTAVTINATTGATQGSLNINGAGVTQAVSSLTINAPNSSSTAVTGTGTLALNGSLSVVNSTTSPGNAFGTTINVANINLGAATRTINVQGQNLGTNDLIISSVIAGGAGAGLTINATASTFNNALATVQFSGAAVNTYTGTTTVNTGNLFLNGPIVTQKIAGDIVIGNGVADPVSGVLANSARVTLGATSQIADTSNMTINADGQFNMASFGETINNLVINSGNVVNVPTAPTLSLRLNGNLSITGGSISGGTGVGVIGLNLQGPAGAAGDVTATSDAAGAALIASNVSLGGVNRTFTVNVGTAVVPAPDLNVTGVIQDPAAGFTKTGAGTMQIGVANTYGGQTVVNNGILAVSGNGGLPSTALGVANANPADTLVNGTGTLLLLNGANTGAEQITLNGVGFTPAGAPGPLGALAVVAGGTGTVGGPITIGLTNTVITAGNGSTLNLTGGINKGNNQNLIIGNAAPGAITATSGIINISGVGISGGVAGTFNSDVLYTAGTTNLLVASPYLGATWFNNGTIVNVFAVGALPSLVTDGGIALTRTAIIMDADNVGNFPLANYPTPPAGAIGGTGGSTLNLFVNQATQFLASGPTSLGTSTVNINANILTIGTTIGVTPGNVDNANFFGVINGLAGAGNISIIKDGTSTQILSGANTYLGLTNVTGGTLQLGNALALGATGLGTNVSAGATLDLGGQQVGVEAITITGTGDARVGLAGGQINGALGNSSATAANLAGVLTIAAGGATVGSTAGNIFLDGQVTGIGNTLTKVFSNTVILNSNANNYGTAAGANGTVITAGVLQVGNGGSTGVLGTGDVLDNATLTFNRNDAITVNNSINGVGVVNQGVAGGPTTGVTLLTGANTYSGLTNVVAGTLRVGNITALGTATSAADGTVVSAGATLDLNGIAVGTEDVTITGTGVLNNGALLNSNVAPASLAGPVTITGVGGASVGGTGDITLSGNIVAGSTGLTKVGGNNLFLTGATNGSTTLTISGGNVQVGVGVGGGATGALGSGAITIVGGSQLIINLNTPFAIAAGNAISGAGGLTQAGTGTTTVNSANTYTGATLVQAGILQLGVAGALGSAVQFTSGVTVSNLASLDLNGISPTANAPLNLNGTTATAGVGALTNSSNGPIATFGGPVTLQTPTSIGGNNGNIKLTGSVGGLAPAALTKIGTNTLDLAGNNGYFGTTTVAQGILQASTNSALGTALAGALDGTTVNGGATLQIAGGVIIGNEFLNVTGNGVSAAVGAINVLAGGPSSYAGPITLNGAGGSTTTFTTQIGAAITFTGGISKNNQTLVFKGAAPGVAGGTFTVSGVGISGPTSFTSDFVADGGSTTWAVANSFAGPTYITNGAILNANVLGALPATAADGSANPAIVRTTVLMDPTAAIPTSPATLTLNIPSTLNLGANTLTIGTSAPVLPTTSPAIFAGVISGAGNAVTGSIMKDGTSVQIFGGALSTGNTYTGSTTVSNGTLQAGVATTAFGVNSATTVGTGVTAATLALNGFSNTIGTLTGNTVGVVQNGAAAGLNSILTLGSGVILPALPALPPTTTFAGVVQDGGASTLGITKTGAGTQIFSGPNTYTGPTTVNAGTLKAGVVTVIPFGPVGTVPNSGAFGINSAVTMANTAGAVLDITGFNTQIGSITGGGAAGGNVTLGAATLTTGGDNSSPAAAYAGTISGTGQFRKIGTGTQILGPTAPGGNTYTGLTTIFRGTLSLSGGNAIVNPSLVTPTAGAVQIAPVTAGHNGTLNLASSETIGSLSDATIGPVAGAVAGSTTTVALNTNILTLGVASINPLGATTFGGTITSTGAGNALKKDGADAFTLSGNTSTYTGGTTLNGGRLNINNSSLGALVSGPVGTGTLTINASNAVPPTAGGNTIGTTTTSGAGASNTIANAVALNASFNVAGTAVVPLPVGGVQPASGVDGVTFSGAVSLNAANVTVNTQGGFLDFTGTIGQNVAGNGLTFTGNTFTLIGAGTALDAPNTYTGLTKVSSGYVLLNKGGAGVAIPGNLQVDAGALVQTTGVAANQIAATSSAVVNGTLDLAGANQTLANLTGAGTVRLDNSVFNAGPATAAAVFSVDSGNFTGSIVDSGPGAGSGSVVKNTAGTLALFGASTYTGGTTMNAGALQAGNGKAFGSGNLTLNGGLIQTIGGPLVVDIGGGNVQFNGGIYQAIVGGTLPGVNHDQLKTTGTFAAPGGTLALVQQNGYLLAPGDKVNLAVATGGVAGGSVNGTAIPNASITGLDVFSVTPLLVPTVNLYPTTVTLEAMQGLFAGINGQTFQGFKVNFTPNQFAVARALDSVSARNLFKTGVVRELNFLDTQPIATLPGNLDKIAPEELTSVFHLAVSLANVNTHNLERRMEDIRMGGNVGFSAPTGGGTRFSGEGKGMVSRRSKEITPPSDDHWGMFLTGTGEFTRIGSNFNAVGYNLTTGGITAGLDYKVNANFAVGLSLGYANTTADLANGGSLDVDGGRLGLYATYYDQNFHVDATVSGGLNSYKTRRVTPNNTVAAGSPDGSEINVSISAGYDFKFGALTVGPVASYQYTNMQLDGFTETGLFAPLTIASKSTDSQRTQLGVRATYDAHVGRVLIRPEMRLAWQHEFGSAGYALTSNFATIGGNAFTVAGTTVGRDSLLASAGFIVMWNDRFGTYVYYDGQFGGSNLESHNVSGGFRLQF